MVQVIQEVEVAAGNTGGNQSADVLSIIVTTLRGAGLCLNLDRSTAKASIVDNQGIMGRHILTARAAGYWFKSEIQSMRSALLIFNWKNNNNEGTTHKLKDN